MFFPRRKDPLDLAAERLLGLRLSLNSPVVQTHELPVGPARAAIVIHEEGDGRPNVTIAVRALRNGEVALYSYEGDLRESSSLAVGIDAALSFGESMGFLFDDDELEGRPPTARSAAHARITGWIDGRPTPAAPSAAASSRRPAGPADEEAADVLVLEQTLEPVPEEPEPAPAAVPPSAVPPPAVARSSRLSKFRGRKERPASRASEPRRAARPRPPASEPGTGRPAALGRVRLVKRRRDGSKAPDERQSLLFRLLALF